MKKKILGAVAVIAIVAMAAFNMNVSTDSNEFSALILSNVEALASGESGTGDCWKTITNQAGSKVLYCGTCTWTDGAKAFLSGKGTCY